MFDVLYKSFAFSISGWPGIRLTATQNWCKRLAKTNPNALQAISHFHCDIILDVDWTEARAFTFENPDRMSVLNLEGCQQIYKLIPNLKTVRLEVASQERDSEKRDEVQFRKHVDRIVFVAQWLKDRNIRVLVFPCPVFGKRGSTHRIKSSRTIRADTNRTDCL
jgi:hypothetical protein